MKFKFVNHFWNTYKINVLQYKNSILLKVLSVIFAFSMVLDMLGKYFIEIFLSLFFLFLCSPPGFSLLITLITYLRFRNIFTPIEITFTKKGIQTNSNNMKGIFFWKVFTHYELTNRTIIIWQDRLVRFYFLESMLDKKNEWEKLVKIISSNVKEGKKINLLKKIVLFILNCLIIVFLFLFILFSIMTSLYIIQKNQGLTFSF